MTIDSLLVFGPFLAAPFCAGLLLVALLAVSVWAITQKRYLISASSFLAFMLFFCVVYIFFTASPLQIYSELFWWQLDLLRGWEKRIPVSSPPYQVTFVHKAGVDFYDTYLEATNGEQQTVIIWIDGDDEKWWNPHTVEQDGKIYILQTNEVIHDDTMFVDVNNQLISVDGKAHDLSKLPYGKGEIDF